MTADIAKRPDAAVLSGDGEHRPAANALDDEIAGLSERARSREHLPFSRKHRAFFVLKELTFKIPLGGNWFCVQENSPINRGAAEIAQAEKRFYLARGIAKDAKVSDHCFSLCGLCVLCARSLCSCPSRAS
jgi:hypothetical protein